MVEWKGNKIYVGFHEWAWSRRTQGFPIFQVKMQNGSFVFKLIGETQKRATVYTVDPFTDFIVRYYESNSGYVTWHVYFRLNSEVKEIPISEQYNFEPPIFSDDVYGLYKNYMAIKKLAEKLRELTLKPDFHHIDLPQKFKI